MLCKALLAIKNKNSMPELVTIATCREPMEAELLRATLEGSGIPCFLFGEHLANTRSHVGFALGVEVRIRAEDVEAAVDLLTEGKKTPAPAAPACPRCNGEGRDITGQKGTIFIVLLFLLTSLFPGYTVRKSYRCANCGFEWK